MNQQQRDPVRGGLHAHETPESPSDCVISTGSSVHSDCSYQPFLLLPLKGPWTRSAPRTLLQNDFNMLHVARIFSETQTKASPTRHPESVGVASFRAMRSLGW